MRPEASSEPSEAGLPADDCVLRSGAAVAVLVCGVGDGAQLRIEAAQRALRLHTGRTDILIDRRPSGRPRLAPPYAELAVSLSHRGDLLLAAFSPAGPVGADIEIDAPGLEPKVMAADHFSSGEAAALVRLGEAGARDLFLRLWVAKEAALKVSGRGIFDGVGEPDLAAHLDRLSRDGSEVRLSSSVRLPALTITTRRLAQSARPTIYCGLAVAA